MASRPCVHARSSFVPPGTHPRIAPVPQRYWYACRGVKLLPSTADRANARERMQALPAPTVAPQSCTNPAADCATWLRLQCRRAATTAAHDPKLLDEPVAREASVAQTRLRGFSARHGAGSPCDNARRNTHENHRCAVRSEDAR